MDVKFDFDEKLEQLAKVPKAVRMAVVVAIPVAIVACFYFVSMKEQRAEIVQLRAEAEDLQRKLNKVRVVINNLDEFQQEIASLERELESALRKLPDRKQFEDLLQDITTAGKKVGVQIKSIERKKEVTQNFYAEVPFKLELEGGYHDLALFFDRVSKLPRIVNIGSFKVEVQSEDLTGTVLKVSGVATTFRFLSEQGGEQASRATYRAGGQV